MPCFWLTICHAAANHTVTGVRVSWKIVPAVRDTRRRQPAQRRTPPAISQPESQPQCGHLKPFGQRNQSR